MPLPLPVPAPGVQAESRTDERRPAWARAIAWLGPDVTLLLGFIAILAGLIKIYGASLVWNDGSIFISLAIGGGLLAARFVYRWRTIVTGAGDARADYVRAARSILRDWGPLILLLFTYESLRSYTGLIRTTSIDQALYQLDLQLFGVEPSVWMGRFAHPLLTDWMTIAYSCYFIMPMVLATSLTLRGHRAQFREFSTVVLLQLSIGFLLYLIFPAGPPRYYAPLLAGGFEPAQLTSYSGLYELSQSAFDAANPLTTRSSFPSLHCSLALVTLIYARRFGAAVFPRRPTLFAAICLPVVVSLWISTIYLRHHWVPDCIAGLALGGLCSVATPWLFRRWPAARQRATWIAEPGRGG